VLPLLAYLEITDSESYGETKQVMAAERLKVLLSHRPSLHVAVGSCVVDDAAAFSEQFGARFAVVEQQWGFWWYETLQLS